MPVQSAGIVLYRRRPKGLEVFLVHPGGPYFAKKDQHAWTIPKGVVANGEEALEAAKREFEEEVGFMPTGPFQELRPVKQSGGKIVQAWAMEGDCDPAALRSNTFEIEWPPRSGKRQRYPEADRAAWFSLDQAKVKINKGQSALLDGMNEIADTLGQAAGTILNKGGGAS
jgi:predicted NUDIX family NTP pyrophosphohydrolase